MTQPHLPGPDEPEAARPAGAPPTPPTMWQQMGGVTGMLDSGLPVVIFVIGNAIGGLTTGIIAAVVGALLICGLRISRRQPAGQALGGLFGVAIAAFIAHRSGSAGGYFLLGIYSYLVYGALLLVSLLVRWPAIGLLWEGINGRGTAWRRDKALVRRYDLATALWVAIFALRYFVQSALLDREAIGWLAFARIAMGYPLWLIGIGVSMLIILRGTGWKMPPLRDLLRGKGAATPDQERA